MNHVLTYTQAGTSPGGQLIGSGWPLPRRCWLSGRSLAERRCCREPPDADTGCELAAEARGGCAGACRQLLVAMLLVVHSAAMSITLGGGGCNGLVTELLLELLDRGCVKICTMDADSDMLRRFLVPEALSDGPAASAWLGGSSRWPRYSPAFAKGVCMAAGRLGCFASL